MKKTTRGRVGNGTVGRLVISVDLEWENCRHDLVDARRLESVTADLLRQLTDHGFPATWAVADPVHSAATDAILEAGRRAQVNHEMGVLGDSTWLGPGSSRQRFAQELCRRFAGSRAGGLDVSSLLLRDVALSEHLDLLVKHGVSVVRQGDDAAPKMLRYGLWQTGQSLRLPLEGRWHVGGEGRAVRRIIRRSSAAVETAHLAIDATRLVDRGSAGLSRIARALQYASRYQQRGLLQVISLSRLIESLAPQRQSRPSRSILRPAA